MAQVVDHTTPLAPRRVPPDLEGGVAESSDSDLRFW